MLANAFRDNCFFGEIEVKISEFEEIERINDSGEIWERISGNEAAGENWLVSPDKSVLIKSAPFFCGVERKIGKEATGVSKGFVDGAEDTVKR